MASIVLGWIVKTVLDKGTAKVINVVRPDDPLSKVSAALDQAVASWAGDLPGEFESFHSPALFLSDPSSSPKPENRPCITALWKVIEDEQIPPQNAWLDALMEQWQRVRRRYGC